MRDRSWLRGLRHAGVIASVGAEFQSAKSFILFTQLVSEEVHPSFSAGRKEKLLVEKVRKHCPSVTWVKNYVALGPWDYVDIFEAPDIETAFRVAALVRYCGGAHTEIWPVTEWDAFNSDIQALAEELES